MQAGGRAQQPNRATRTDNDETKTTREKGGNRETQHEAGNGARNQQFDQYKERGGPKGQREATWRPIALH